MIKFNTKIRQKIVPDLVTYLSKFEEITEFLHHKSTKTLMWNPIDKDSHHLYDHNNQICIGDHSGEAITLEIVNRIFKQLLSIFREVSEQLKQLQTFKFADYIRVT
ncbi:hypothetical protein cce_0170 [Crocosphaera subtropica ATCC 51142]|uniref:Uncharacterized protein n=1 Tax=Crocosphaera subtropica (strain ATCC 51142 / BH68) TaxID=43989 RepID=B1WZF6_CROS5|nr:hypothetical protein [Crocosphaera subtropica]ACB49522.1 hypothetical protein cce_0170 [Crocosphaera subtropica ATCC 51142]